MMAWYGDGIGPDDFADPAPADLPTRITVTLTPRSEGVDDLEVAHTPDITSSDVVDLLSDVVDVLRASGPGLTGSGVIFGGIERER